MNYAELFRVTMPETALELAALLVLVVDLGFLRKASTEVRTMVAALLGVFGCGLALVTLGWQIFGPLTYPMSDEVLLSSGGYTTAAQVGILTLTVLTLFLLVDSDFTHHVGEYVAVLLMAAAGGLLVAAAQDLLIIFIGLELLSLGLYILTAFAKKSARSAEAAMKYYLFGGMSAAFLLFGFSYLYGIAGSTNLHSIVLATYEPKGAATVPLLYVALVMIAAGLGFKVAAVPFHLWAPDTYEGAPGPAAAFIASVSKVASFALLIGIATAVAHVMDPTEHLVAKMQDSIRGESTMLHLNLGFSGAWSTILILMSAASMLVGNLAALAQTSVRRLLAYSAIAHAGYMLLGLAYFSYTPASANALMYYVLSYGLTTVGAFGAVAVVQRETGSDRMDAFLGLHKRNPLVAGVLLVTFLSLAGIPPLVGFWAKFILFSAVLGVHGGTTPMVLVALAVGMSAVSLYYYLQVLKRVYVMPAVDETPITMDQVTTTALVFIAFGVVALGCMPGLLLGWIEGF